MINKNCVSPYLLVPGPHFSIEIQSFLRLHKFPTMQQVSADHHPRAAFSRFAVNRCDVVLVLGEPMIEIFTERLNELQLRRVVVFKRVLSHCQRQKNPPKKQKTRSDFLSLCNRTVGLKQNPVAMRVKI